MVLGSTRERPTVEGHDAAPEDRLAEWRMERGVVRLEGGVDLAGGFPGFAERGGRLVGVQFRLTDHYLLVEEGRPHGFGLPLAWLLGADLFVPPRAERPEPLLRLRYYDGVNARTFQVRFRGSLLSPRGGRRVEQALAALHALGLAEAGEPLPAAPEFGVSWDEAARFEDENVIWSGEATALVGAAGERAACDVWLTTRSIIWGSSTGSGILRLPIDAVVDAVPADLADRAMTPAVYVAATDDDGGRHEVPFLFDRHSPAQRNLRERGAFVVGLRSRGVPLGAAPPLPQPWRDGVIPQVPLPPVPPADAPEGAPAGNGGVSIRPRRPAPSGRFRPRPLPVDAADAPGRWERAMAEWTGHQDWVEAQDDAEPTMHERLRQILGEPDPEPSPADEAADRPERGVILPWPGTRRPAGEKDAAGTEGGESAPLSLVHAADTAPAEPPPAGETQVPSPPDDAPDADAPVSVASFPFSGAWPVPSGFLGAVAIEPPGPVAGEPAAAGSAPDADNVSGEARAADTDASLTTDDGARELRATDVEAPALATDPAADQPRAALRRYEAAVLRVITEAIRAIEDRSTDAGATAPVPTPAERAAAFAALDALVTRGEMTAAAAEVHRSLLIAAGEAGPRLRSLLELRGAGYLADDDLDRKRRQIVAPLAALLAR